MTDIAEPGAALADESATAGRAPIPTLFFAVTVFFSAALVFAVEPMIARLILPRLGGSVAVWNTSLAFFQAVLLVGYLYAHLLQRLGSVRRQILGHLAVLCLAGLALPLRVSGVLGDPPPEAPVLWLIGVLALSIGAPFAALSATAPLVQAWHAAAVRHDGAKEPYVLYAASNFGSLIALVAYPVLIEPNLALRAQTGGWSLGYGVFVATAAALGLALWRAPATAPAAAAPVARTRWLERLVWLALAAIPSSLMLGVTTHITTDVGSAPFLWVAPLALYLLTFIIAFQARPVIPLNVTLPIQAGATALCAAMIHGSAGSFLEALAIHLTAFFFTALMCHQTLVARRPEPARLTEFYIWMSVGGVVGGAFNAFIAPAVFDTVAEYPAVLVLACLARPWGKGRIGVADLSLTLVGVLAALAAAQVGHPPPALRPLTISVPHALPVGVAAPIVLGLALGCAVLVRRRAIAFAAVILALVIAAETASDQFEGMASWRSFFGVLRLIRTREPALGGEVRMLAHGSTLHGAQAMDPARRCQPLVYYAHETPIGQVFQAELARKAALDIGAVGLGAGTVSTYTRPGDQLRFFEIDPLVKRVAADSGAFSYLTGCARGKIAYAFGDARLSLATQRAGAYDLLLIDAFSSDSVPAHLLTVEAMRMYLERLKPDGVLVLHLTNRNLDLMRPAEAVARAAGAAALAQHYDPPVGTSVLLAAREDALIAARSPAALARFAANPAWRPIDPEGVAPWTDDYTNLFGALTRRIEERAGWLRPAVPRSPRPAPPALPRGR